MNHMNMHYEYCGIYADTNTNAPCSSFSKKGDNREPDVINIKGTVFKTTDESTSVKSRAEESLPDISSGNRDDRSVRSKTMETRSGGSEANQAKSDVGSEDKFGARKLFKKLDKKKDTDKVSNFDISPREQIPTEMEIIRSASLKSTQSRPSLDDDWNYPLFNRNTLDMCHSVLLHSSRIFLTASSCVSQMLFFLYSFAKERRNSSDLSDDFTYEDDKLENDVTERSNMRTTSSAELMLAQASMKIEKMKLYMPTIDINTELTAFQLLVNMIIRKFGAIGGLLASVVKVFVVQTGYLILYILLYLLKQIQYMLSQIFFVPSVSNTLVFFNVDYLIEDYVDLQIYNAVENTSCQTYLFTPTAYEKVTNIFAMRQALAKALNLPYQVRNICKEIRIFIDDLSTGLVSLIGTFELIYTLFDLLTLMTSLLSFALLNINFVMQNLSFALSTLNWFAQLLIYYIHVFTSGIAKLKSR